MPHVDSRGPAAFSLTAGCATESRDGEYASRSGRDVIVIRQRVFVLALNSAFQESSQTAPERRIAMSANLTSIMLAMALFAAPASAEPIKIAYSGVSVADEIERKYKIR